MTQNKNQLELPPIPDRPENLPTPEGRAWELTLERDKTLGKLAITLEDDSLHYEAYTEKAQTAEEAAAAMAVAKRNPRYSSVGRLRSRFGQRRGKIMTNEEADFVEDVAMTIGATTEYYTSRAQETRGKLAEEVKNIRGRFGELNEGPANILETYMNSMASDELKQKKDGKAQGENLTWAAWLARKAEDKDVLACLREHNELLKSQQESPETARLIESQREIYKIRVRHLVAGGILHKDALRSLDNVDGIDVRIGDVFDTIMDDNHGYHILGQRFFVVSGAAHDGTASKGHSESIARNIEETMPHEMNHAVLGKLGERWLDEALTELVATDIRGGDALSYPYEIALLSVVLDEDKEGDVHSLAKRAYSEKTGSESYDRLTSEVQKVWREYAPEQATGHEIFNAINACVARHEKALVEKGRTLTDARNWAVIYTRLDLKQNPHSVFNVA